MCVYFRSDGLGPTGAGAAAGRRRSRAPRRRAAEPRRTSSNPVFWGLNGPALGSRRVYAPCVNHLRHLRGSVGLWAAPSRTAAALRGGASPADAFPLLECTTEHGIRRKSIREAGQSLPSARGGRSRNGVTSAASPAAKLGGAPVTKSLQGLYGLAGALRRSVQALQRCSGVQIGSRPNGGERIAEAG